ncbi:SANT/Myb domain [Dillenia turbinata]|uniref:SANT/Myb domain n=1 Tax=Dillenia turbinata TaxID=194707 RepID=A0AAN8UYA2_9MAGN
MTSSVGVWTREEEQAFENGIGLSWTEGSEEHWNKIASLVPNKTLEELKQHYQVLLEDVNAIEAGHVPLPNYAEETSSTTKDDHQHQGFSAVQPSEKRSNSGFAIGFAGLGSDGSHAGKGRSRSEQERRKGIPWTEEEHRLFLLGPDKFGKGGWRSISHNFVISRTPTPVASHAQKYFIRLNSMNKDRRRSSIHDLTSVNGADASSPQATITGQQTNTNPTSGHSIGQLAKHRPQPNTAGLGMYGAPVGHPVAAAPGHLASAVGTPVNATTSTTTSNAPIKEDRKTSIQPLIT